jgi:hypothetical protein
MRKAIYRFISPEPDKVGECLARDLQKSLFKLLGSAKQVPGDALPDLVGLRIAYPNLNGNEHWKMLLSRPKTYHQIRGMI